MSSLTGGHGAKPTYNQTFHPSLAPCHLTHPLIEVLQDLSSQLSKCSVSVCLMDIQYADQRLII